MNYALTHCSFCYFKWSCAMQTAFPHSPFTSIPNERITLRIRSPCVRPQGRDWEFIQGPGLCLVCTLCKGSILLQVFIHSLNHGKLIGFHTGMSGSCFLLLFIWTRADNSLGIFQTSQSLLRFLQTRPYRQTDSTEEGNNRAGFVMVTSYLCRVSTRCCRMNTD